MVHIKHRTWLVVVTFTTLASACASDGDDAGTGRMDVSDATTTGELGDALGDDATDPADAADDATDGAPSPDGSVADASEDVGPEDALPSDTGTLDDGAPSHDTGAPSGTACSDDATCASGWCVPSALGQVCVDVCTDVCDDGEACIPAAESGTDPVFLCVPFAPPSGDTIGGDTSTSDIGSDGGDGTSTSDIDSDGSDGTSTSDIGSPGDSGAADGEDATPTETVGDAEPGDVPLEDTGPSDDTVVDDVVPDGADVPGEETIGGDSDGDGIPDDEDNLPCVAIYLVVYNNDVTSASLLLNGAEVVAPNAFPTDEPITVTVNPTAGENTLALGGQLTGSPSDTLTVVIADGDGRIYFATVIMREPGKPADHSYTFDIDVTCP